MWIELPQVFHCEFCTVAIPPERAARKGAAGRPAGGQADLAGL